MAIVFPRAMPDRGPAEQYFEPEGVAFLNPEASGHVGGVAAGETLWAGVWDLGQMGRTLAEEWRAWIATLRTPTPRLFLGRDFARPMPLLVPSIAGMTRAGGGAWDADGTASSWSVNADGDVLTLNGLPANLPLSRGDYVGFRWTRATYPTTARALVRLANPATANGSGVAVCDLIMAVPGVVPGGAVAYLVKPVCLMRPTPETKVAAMDRRLVSGAHLSAVQVLYA